MWGKKSGDIILSLRLRSDEEEAYNPYWIFCCEVGRDDRRREGGQGHIAGFGAAGKSI
ncbi:MAG: hypothetical protein KIH08_06460 [Candidatus Freyarchaeota archaeon]|nr:hypothetical protein [Candidatus Jordarchaeia archaeon]MBS7280104.1 hypothetical protein [Candidatus Jordarchaeia archaeon]